ncbi:hypothetical protein C0991_012545, partial [Blastosporella zonata]
MSPLRPPDEEKRPANVYYTPGTKTPRRVQWLDADSASGIHSLDEQGLDPAAFHRLTQALERHRTSTRVHHYPPQPEPAHSMDISDLGANTRFENEIQQPAPAVQSIEVSPSISPHHRPITPHHYVPGNYIDAIERAGLPGLSDPSHTAQEQAEKVVNSLNKKRRFGVSSSRTKLTKKWNKTKKMFGRPSDDDVKRADVERDAGISTPDIRGGGVLSTLLSLYGEMDLASGMSTPGTSSVEDFSERSWIRPPEEHHHPPRRSGPLDEPRPSRLAQEVIPDSPSLSRQSTRGDDEKKEYKSQQSTPASFLHRHKKPKTRSGAGVFGPLIASTGNLTGFVAPTQSQLQPDFKRPGYGLSRYSYDDKPKPSGTTSKPPTRPPSVYSNVSSYAPSLASSPPSPSTTDPGPSRPKWQGMLKDLPVPSIRSFGGRSGASTPARSMSPMMEGGDGYFDLKRPSDAERWKEKRKRKRARVFPQITRHVAHILERQAFILKFARAMMMFGAPSHRLQSQLNSTARVLDLEMSCVYFPDVLLVSFDDSSTSTSNVKIIRQGSALDLVKLSDSYRLYWKVIHDKLSVSDASSELDTIMRRPQLYNWWKLILFGGMCSSSICTVSFDGSFIDALIVFPMGALLIAIQLLSVRNELYSNVFDGALELMSRNIVAGSVRLGYAVMYALFLGFGLAMGAKAFVQFTGTDVVGSDDVACAISHHEGAPWYQTTPSKFWAFLTVPMFSLFISLRNQAPYDRVELPLLVGIACIGWVANHFTGVKFVNQTDISAAVG